MKIVCSRLARTIEELSDFVFEIRYVPGHLNSAADALSRLNCHVPHSDDADLEPVLPFGLVLDGPPVPGGGDSLFVSLLRALYSLGMGKDLPRSENDLRAILVDDLMNNAVKYNITLDRESRKQLRLMRCKGQLPALDVLLAVSRLFQVRVFVYFWSTEPIVYQFENFKPIVHLQCVSGIHFNPLIEVVNYTPPIVPQTAINSVHCDTVAGMSSDVLIPECDDDDAHELILDHSLYVEKAPKFCAHIPSSLPQVCASFGELQYCAILDTGAEISLVSKSALESLGTDVEFNLLKERVCDIVGLSGVRTPIEYTVELKFDIGTYSMPVCHKFAVVDNLVFPYCFLLGLDFMTEHDISIDLKSNSCKQNFKSVSKLVPRSIVYSPSSAEHHLLLLQADLASSHQLRAKLSSDDLRFEIGGNSTTISGLSLLMEDDAIKHVQSKCPEVALLKELIVKETPCKHWPNILKRFSRHAHRLSIIDDTLVYNDNDVSHVIVVPLNIVLEIAIVLHFGFAHVGRDKLLDLMTNLVWHPMRYSIVSDVCTTCHQCQITKIFSTPIVPPTLKICTSYPFELVAADLVSLPTTAAGFLGCLVVVDHFSKWVAAVPIKNKKAATIVKCFADNIFPFLPRLPTNILTDNGPEFTSSELTKFLSTCNVNHKLTTPYCSKSNGAIERVHRSIQNFLKNLVAESNTWDVHLSKAIITYNNTYHCEICMSPSKFLLTKSHKVDADPPLQGKLRDTWKLGHPKFIPFKVEQLVLMKEQHKDFRNVNKLSPNFRGPFSITKVNDNGLTYQLSALDSNTVIRAHHSQLRLYKSVPTYIAQNPCYVEVTRGGAGIGLTNCSSIDIVDNIAPNFVDASSMDESSVSGGSDREDAVSLCNNNPCDVPAQSDSVSCSSFSGFDDSDVHSITANSQSNSSGRSVLSSTCTVVGLCRGCHFEARLEANSTFLDNIEGSGVTEENIFEPPEALEMDVSGNIVSSFLIDDVYKLTVLEWEEDNDWQLSSLDSNYMIDESGENTDPEVATLELELGHFECTREEPNCISLTGNYADVAQSSSSSGTLVDEPAIHSCESLVASGSGDSFCGFGTSQTGINSLHKLNEIRSNVIDVVNTELDDLGARSETSHVQHTRSRGSVSLLPNVQPKVLERSRRKK
jgi:hypothetical protein